MIPLRWHHQPANQTCLVGGTAGQLATPQAWAPPLANPSIPTQVGWGTLCSSLWLTEHLLSIMNCLFFRAFWKPNTENSNSHIVIVFIASGVPSMSKAKSQTFDPFADLGNLGTNLPGKMPGQIACNGAFKRDKLLLWIYYKSQIYLT